MCLIWECGISARKCAANAFFVLLWFVCLFVCLFVCSHISLIVVIELESVSGTMQRVFGWMFKRPYWNKKGNSVEEQRHEAF